MVILGFMGILVIFRFWGVFRSFLRFRTYFCHFLVSGGVLVILKVSGVFRLFFRFKGYFGFFFFSFRGYFGNVLSSRSTLVIL